MILLIIFVIVISISVYGFYSDIKKSNNEDLILLLSVLDNINKGHINKEMNILIINYVKDKNKLFLSKNCKEVITEIERNGI